MPMLSETVEAPPPVRPTTWSGPITEALHRAQATREPLVLPLSCHCDDRGWSIMNQFQGVLGPDGQINFSVQHPGVIKAWHRHQKQVDFWLCLTGHLKVGVHRESDGRNWAIVIGERQPAVVIIPPPLWHGAATVGSDPAGLLYYVTRAYNPTEPDEQRRSHDSVPGFTWKVVHR